MKYEICHRCSEEFPQAEPEPEGTCYACQRADWHEEYPDIVDLAPMEACE
jgi:hypothetical protein